MHVVRRGRFAWSEAEIGIEVGATPRGIARIGLFLPSTPESAPRHPDGAGPGTHAGGEPPGEDLRAAELADRALAEVLEVLSGRRQAMGVPADLEEQGASDFARAVWERIRAIPPGALRTYGEIARELGRGPGGARAVGRATGANPLPLFVPCHRVVGAGGRLTGFSCGLEIKAQLLRSEGHELWGDGGHGGTVSLARCRARPRPGTAPGEFPFAGVADRTLPCAAGGTAPATIPAAR